MSIRSAAGIFDEAQDSARSPRISLDSYAGFAGLPPLVGLHTMAEAATTGLTVSDSVAPAEACALVAEAAAPHLRIAHYE